MPVSLAAAMAAAPAGSIRPASSRRATRPLLIRVHMLPVRRGANHCIERSSSTGLTVESTHP